MSRPRNLTEIEHALRQSWGVDVCEDPADVPHWSPRNPARGQCGPTALVLHDLLGGELVVAQVTGADGGRRGFHWWNVLPGGAEVDLTREQFRDGEVVGPGRVLARPAGPMRRGEAEYLTLLARVLAVLDGQPPSRPAQTSTSRARSTAARAASAR